MRQVFASGVLLLLCSVPAFAQVGDPKRNYDFEKPLYTVVDVASKAWFSGWSGDCNTGRLPVAFTLYRIDNGHLVNVPVTLTTGARPDAAAYLAGVCNRPFETAVGWSLVPKSPEPDGEFLYAVIVTDIPASWYCGPLPGGGVFCDYAANQVYRIVQ